MKQRRVPRQGWVTIESLFSMMIMLGSFCFVMQTANFYSTGLAVQTAAASAARKAATALAVCPADMEGASLYSVDYTGRTQHNDRLLKLMAAYGVGDGSARPIRNARGGPRLQEVRDAASARLTAFGPDREDIMYRGQGSFWSMVGGGVPEDRATFAAAVYNRIAMAVTFHAPEGASHNFDGQQTIQFGPDEDYCVRVTYLAYCSAPVLSDLFCDSYESIRDARPEKEIRLLEEARESEDPDAIRLAADNLRDAERSIRAQSERFDALQYAEAPWAGWMFDDRAGFE